MYLLSSYIYVCTIVRCLFLYILVMLLFDGVGRIAGGLSIKKTTA